MEIELQEDFISPRISFRRNGSLVCPHPSLLIDSLGRKSFSYNKLPSQPLTLTVIKLDGSSFGTMCFHIKLFPFFFFFFGSLWIQMNLVLVLFAVIEVPKTGTVAQLKQGVEAAFSHLPRNGPGTVSWYVNYIVDFCTVQ